MPRSALFAFVFLSILSLASPWTAASDLPPPTESETLQRIFGAHSKEFSALFPLVATRNGVHRYDDQLPDWLSPEFRNKVRSFCRRYLDEVRGIDAGPLDADERISLAVFRRNMAHCLEEIELDFHLLPVSQLSFVVNFPVMGSGAGGHPFRNARDYDNFLSRIDGFVRWIDSAIANMRQGMEVGVTQPRAVMEATLPILHAIIVDDPQASQFYQPIRNFPASISATDRERLDTAYAAAIRDKVMPAYRKLASFIEQEYLPKSRSSDGFGGMPGGARMYAYTVRKATTTDLTPDQLFDLGLREIARIEVEMRSVQQQLGHEGSIADLMTELGKRPEGLYRNREELVAAYRALEAKVAPQMHQLFGRLPKAGFEVRPIEAFREKSTQSNYAVAPPDASRPGVFYLNAMRAAEGGARVSEALFLHEAIPGHHLQLSLQRENRKLPPFRRFAFHTAYVEGWGLYAESLGARLGLYTDPWQKLDMLNFDMWRAVRLVVDVGLHAKGWTREQAIQFMLEHSPRSRAEAELEITRYMAMPGQALAYKVGQLKILELRDKAEQTLGARFDLRAFHDELLKDGGLPLDVLEEKMNAWLKVQAEQ